ncbi:hypothetical protein Hanom_Chr15g01413461 [Helianthus anomalus]
MDIRASVLSKPDVGLHGFEENEVPYNHDGTHNTAEAFVQVPRDPPSIYEEATNLNNEVNVNMDPARDSDGNSKSRSMGPLFVSSGSCPRPKRKKK